MNEQSSGDPPGHLGDDPEGKRRELAASLQRRFMERARIAAERDQVKPPSRLLQHVLAMIAALIVVCSVVFGFNAFLTSMQKVMRMLDEDERRQKQELEQQQKRAIPETEPMPAYVVPPDEA